MSEVGSPQMIGREKYWEEKSQEEKIESLAACVRQLADQIYQLTVGIGEFEDHSHGMDGLPVVRLTNRRNREYGGPHMWARELRQKPRTEEK